MTISQEQYRMMLARTAPRQGTVELTAAAKRYAREQEIHNEIAADILHRGWLGLHGRMDTPTGRTLGETDFVILQDGGRSALVEVKLGNNKPDPDQLAFHAWALKLGHTPHVVRSLEEFIQKVTR